MIDATEYVVQTGVGGIDSDVGQNGLADAAFLVSVPGNALQSLENQRVVGDYQVCSNGFCLIQNGLGQVQTDHYLVYVLIGTSYLQAGIVPALLNCKRGHPLQK